MFCRAFENLLGHMHGLLHQNLPRMHFFFRTRYSKVKNELLAKTIKKWTGRREIPWDGSPWLQSLALFSTQPAGCSSLLHFWALFAATHYKPQVNKSLSISGQCQALVLWAANPYLSSQLHRLSSPCQTTLFYTDVPSPCTTSQFVCLQSHSLFPHFISLQRLDPRPIETFPPASMGFESGPTSLSLSGILSCLWVNIPFLFARPLFPFPFHSAIWNLLWDLLFPAWPTHAGKDTWGPVRQRSWKKV